MFAGFVARIDNTRLPKCVMFGELVGGAGCVGGQEKEWMGCLLDDLRAFGINAGQWTAAAQDEGNCRKTTEHGAERFMAKQITAEKARAGLRHEVVCSNVTGRIKERIAQSKRARASFACHSLLAPNGANLYPPGGCRVVFSGVTSVLLCFVFVFLLSLKKSRSFVQSFLVLRYASAAPTATRSYLTIVCILFRFCFFHFFYLEKSLFQE